MPRSRKNPLLKTEKRIRLGIWGLGRGLHLAPTCTALNFDVVAGCDYNEHMRKRFAKSHPGALVTADAEEFLDADFDAVLLATFCPAHAADAIRCLEAGKHVLSEVTAFYTMAEGVRLVEAVERTGLVYNLAENYPFTKPNLYLAAKWREGLFGELMYAEYDYVHECRPLCFTYIDGLPVQPGHTAHNWRSWINFHYYNTHSLGPVMHITNTRPTRVVSLPVGVRLAGYLVDKASEGMGGAAPSLITMSNGAVMRNLMGAMTNDSHAQRLWGTKGAAEITDGLYLRLGGAGGAPKLRVTPEWPELGEFADTTGHGGGDFWVLYQFARQILFGERAFFDVYNAADCTSPGILAYRSSLERGTPYDVPDFRKKADRDRHRHDHFGQKPYDVEHGCFPKNADPKLTGQFTTIMSRLIPACVLSRSVTDWIAVAGDVDEPDLVIEVADRFLRDYQEIKRIVAAARKLANAYPTSDGARVIREMLDLADAGRVMRRNFTEKITRERLRLKRLAAKTRR